MPILAIDSMGNYYETDPDSSEGDGCKGMVRTSQMGDMTLDNSIVKAENKRRRQLMSERAGFAAIDAREAQAARSEHALASIRRKQNENTLFNQNTPQYKHQMMIKGLAQTARDNHNSDGNIGLSGNGMTANGMMGSYGKNKHQRGAEIALGLGNNYDAPCAPNTDYNNPDAANTPCSVTEQQQYWLCKRVEQALATDAMRKAQTNMLIDATNGGDGSESTDGGESVSVESQGNSDGGSEGNGIPPASPSVSQTVAVTAPVTRPPPVVSPAQHPMFSLFFSVGG